MAVSYRFAVLRFDDRNRYGQDGVPGTFLFAGGESVIVRVKPATQAKAGKRNRFAKVAALSSSNEGEAALIELLGPVGEYASELEAYQLHFGVKPCRYPQKEEWALTGLLGGVDGGSLPPCEAWRRDCSHLHVVSVDNASTRDIDDALSIEASADGGVARTWRTWRLSPEPSLNLPRSFPAGVELGIHVADVAAHISPASPLFRWALERAGAHGPPRRDRFRTGQPLPSLLPGGVRVPRRHRRVGGRGGGGPAPPRRVCSDAASRPRPRHAIAQPRRETMQPRGSRDATEVQPSDCSRSPKADRQGRPASPPLGRRALSPSAQRVCTGQACLATRSPSSFASPAARSSRPPIIVAIKHKQLSFGARRRRKGRLARVLIIKLAMRCVVAGGKAVSRRHVRDTSATCPRHVRDMSSTRPRHVPEGCLAPARADTDRQPRGDHVRRA